MQLQLLVINLRLSVLINNTHQQSAERSLRCSFEFRSKVQVRQAVSIAPGAVLQLAVPLEVLLEVRQSVALMPEMAIVVSLASQSAMGVENSQGRLIESDQQGMRHLFPCFCVPMNRSLLKKCDRGKYPY